MTNPIFVMRCGASSCTAIYRPQTARQFLHPSNLTPMKMLTANLTAKNVDGLPTRHEDCYRTRPAQPSTSLPASMSGFVRNTPPARLSRPRIFSARFCAPMAAGNGYPRSWRDLKRNGGATCSAPAVLSLNWTQSTCGEAA